MANEEILELQINDNASIAAEGLERLSTTLTKVKEAIGKGLNLKGTVSGLEKLKNAVNEGLNEDSVARFERLAETLERLKSIGGLKIAGIKNIAGQLNVADSLTDAKEAVQETVDTAANAIDLGMAEVEERSRETANSFGGTWGSVKQKLSEVWHGITDVKDAANEKGNVSFFDGFKEGISGVREHIKGLMSDFQRIVKYRMIRSIIKQITQGFTEGVKNMYFYSKAIGGDFASSMNDAAASLLQFKNSLGAAAAPLIQMLIPYLKQVINYAIQAVNYINQFLALLRGQTTWTKALYKATDAFTETGKKAKGAGKQIKDLLADWDELNIIQSESGGGGGGAGKAAEDYTKMFEETNKFNEALKDHFADILDMVKKVGLLIGAWKFSKAFTGFASKLFKLASGLLLIDIGFRLAYDAGFDIGLNGLNAKNAVEGIIGTLAAALGGSVITKAIGLGGGIGAAIGVGVAIVATLIGYINGQKDLQDKNKWGNLTWTQKQIESFVKSQFKFDVTSEINVLDGEIANRQEAIDNLNTKIDDFKTALNDANVKASISIDSDDTNGAITAAAAEAKKAIAAVETMIKDSGEGIDVILKKFNFVNDEGTDVTKDLMSNVSIDDEKLTSYFMGIGDELAALIEKGQHEHWKNADTKQAALDLMERERKILEEAKALQADIELDIAIQSGFDKGISRETAKGIMEEQKAALKEYEEVAGEAIREQAKEYSYLAGLAEAASRDAFEHGDSTNGQELHEAAERYKERASTLLNGLEDAVNGKLEETKRNMAAAWSETLKTVYGEDFNSSVNGRAFKNFVQGLTSLSQYGDTTTAGKEIREQLIKLLGGDDPNGIVNYVLNDLQGSLFDLFSDEMRKSLYNTLLEETNNDYDAVSEILQNIFGVSESDIKKMFKDEFAVRKRHGWKGEWPEDPNAWEGIEVEEEWVDLDAPEEQVYDALEEVQQIIDENAPTLTIDPVYSEPDVREAEEEINDLLKKRPNQFGIGGHAMPDYNVPSYYTTGAANVNGDNVAEQVTVGVKGANEPQNELLRSMIGYLSTISQNSQKDPVVNVTLAPSYGWGQHNAKSNAAYEKVTGQG